MTEKEWEIFQAKRAAIYAKNEALIKKWHSVPWWKFWLRPSFEEQRDIILRNWREVNRG